MQFTMGLDDRPDRLAEIDRCLHAHSTLPPVTHRLAPVDQLVKGIIGSRTRSEVSMAALLDLKRIFQSWEAVRDGNRDKVERVIAATTFADNKTTYLLSALSLITDASGQVSLDRLTTMSTPDAMRWLETLPGVGRKVSASTLNASTL
ncbi:MAG: hypothetical protein ACSHX3_14270 [Litorimonas sp.]